MAKAKKTRRIILNNSGYALEPHRRETPIGVEGLVAEAITPLVGTHVDTLFWCLGADSMDIANISNVYCHDTKIGEKYGENWTTFPDSKWWRLYENFRDMLAQGNDPPKVVVDHGHAAGLEVFLSLRVNDVHDGTRSDLSDVWSRYKREHPELLLGRQDGLSDISWTGLNYARPEVREHRLAIIGEALELYEMDGFELDFMRMPAFFDPATGYAHRHVMTDFVQRVKTMIDKLSGQRGTPILLAVRVPASFQTCDRIGLDVRRWFNEGLLDLVTIGGGYNPFDYPLKAFIDAAHEADCQLYSCYNNTTRTPAVTRAWAHQAWQAGVDGLYMFNWGAYLATDPQPLLSQIGDPGMLVHADKQYDLESFGGPKVLDNLYWTPAKPLPMRLDVTPPGADLELSLCIADDLDKARAGGRLLEVVLRLKLSDLTPVDRLTFTVNGHPLDVSQAEHSRRLQLHHLQWRMEGPQIKQGDNRITVAVHERNAAIEAPLLLNDVAIVVRYRDGE